MGALSTSASFLSTFWNDQLVEHERQGIFLVLVGFLGSFGFIRLSARLGRSPRFPWWPGSVVSDSGVHLHHLVWGICLMTASGALGFALFDSSPWFEVCAACFGIGAGLTFDEFALWIYLEDVYWAREGRRSIDAAVVAGAGLLLVTLGSGAVRGRHGQHRRRHRRRAARRRDPARAGRRRFAKQRFFHGTFGIFISPARHLRAR